MFYTQDNPPVTALTMLANKVSSKPSQAKLCLKSLKSGFILLAINSIYAYVIAVNTAAI